MWYISCSVWIFFIKYLVLKGYSLGLIAIAIVIHRCMVWRNIIRAAFGIDTLEKQIEADKASLSCDVKSINNCSLWHSCFLLLKNLTKQIKSCSLCLGESKIDDTEPLKHWDVIYFRYHISMLQKSNITKK